MGSSRVTRLGASVLLSLALSVGITSTALGVSTTDPSPGRSSSASNADAQPATTGYTVSGTVYGAGGSPVLAGVNVQVQFAPDTYNATTGPGGTYTVTGVPGGRSYLVFFFDPLARYLNGCYDNNVPVSHFSSNNQLATGYLVNANVTGLDVRLGAGVHISGLVINTSGVALSGITVEAYVAAAFGYQEYTTTLADGTYSVLIPPNASYTLSFTDYSSSVYSTGYYDSAVSWSHLAYVGTSATPVPVGNVGSDVSNINVTMTKPWSLQISVGVASVVVGTTVTLTATTNQELGPTPYYCVILDSSNTVLASSLSGMTCTTTVTSATPASKSYHAVVGNSDGTGAVVATSPLTVTWVPDHLVLSPANATMAAGATTPYTARGYDATNHDLGDVTASTAFTISGGGSCTGTSCTSTVAAAHTVTGSDGSAHGSTTLYVNPAAPDHLVLSPADATVEAGFGRVFDAHDYDVHGNVIADVTSATTYTVVGGSCSGAICSSTAAGDHTVTGTDGTLTGTAMLHVTPSALHHLVLNPSGATIAAGGSQAYTAEGFDAFGNSLGDAASATTFNIGGTGSCTGTSCTSTAAGDHTVTGTDGTATGTATLHVTPGPLDHLVLSPANATVAAGVRQAYTAEGFDAHGNGLGDITSATTFTTSGFGTCAGASCWSNTPGTVWVSGIDGPAYGAMAFLHVTPAAATHLAVSGLDTPRVAGAAGSATVTALDAYGNTATGYSGTVHFTSSDAKAVLPANATLSAGVGTFSVTLRTAGTQSVTATDTGNSSITGTQSGIVVNPAAAKTLVVSGLTTPRTAGTTGSIRVTALDAYGNRVHSYLGTVHFTSSDAKAKLPANYKFTAADAGTHVFSGTVILKTAGTQSVTATDTVTKTIKGSQTGIVVKAAAVKTLVVSGLTTPRTAGTTGSIRVTAVDAYGNRVHSYLGTVHFSSSDAKAKLPANYKFTATDAGTHVFVGAVILKTAGTKSVTATDTKTATIKGSQTGIVVKAAAVKTLVVSGLTTPRTKGVAGSIRVTAVDAYGNRVSSYRGTVHFTSSDAKAKLPANYKFTAADNGTHVFVGTVILKTAGTQSVTATDTKTASIKGSQTGIVVK